MHRTPLSFDDLHRSKKWAFIDGLLTGAILVWFAAPFRDAIAPKKTEDL